MHDLQIPLSPLEASILSLCARYAQSRIPEAAADASMSSALEKLKTVFADPSSPYDVHLTLTQDELFNLDSSLHLMMADASIAKEVGDIADFQIGEIYISQLAQHIPLMREVLRRFKFLEELALVRRELEILRAKFSKLEREEPQ